MSFQSGLCKLSMRTDIDESEIILNHRQRLIEEKLLKCYTDEVASEICKLVLLNCNGCRIDHPSQRQHDCLMMEAEEKIWMLCQKRLLPRHLWWVYKMSNQQLTGLNWSNILAKIGVFYFVQINENVLNVKSLNLYNICGL